jgi:DNA-binding GntR family transcriptional regulator
MEEAIPRTTLTLEAYRALRRAILNRRYPPGTKLVVRELAEALGLSPTPVKEALAALEREGLVRAIPHRGYQVPAPGLEDIREIYELREALEGLAARLAALKGGADLLDRLQELLLRQREAAAQGDLEAYGDLDLAFHHALWEASGNQRLLRSAENLDGQVRLLISTSAAVPGRLPSALTEHGAILERLSARDPEGAERAMRLHVRNAWEALRTHLSASPGAS